MIRQHLGFTLSVCVKFSADGVAGESVFLDDMCLAVGALTDNQHGIIGHRGRTENKSNEHAIATVIFVFIVSLLFLPGLNALAVWG